MTLHEPATFLTDFVLSGLCLYFWRKLTPAEDTSPGGPRLRRASFLVLAASALAGSFYHGFDYLAGPDALRAIWIFTQITGCVWAYLLAVFAAAGFRNPGARRFLTVFLTIKLVVMIAVAAMDGRFVWVVIESASSLAVTGTLAVQRWTQTREPEHRYTLAGVILAFSGAAVQVAGLAPHPAFNHNDLFHVILMAAVWCFYRAGLETPG